MKCWNGFEMMEFVLLWARRRRRRQLRKREIKYLKKVFFRLPESGEWKRQPGDGCMAHFVCHQVILPFLSFSLILASSNSHTHTHLRPLRTPTLLLLIGTHTLTRIPINTHAHTHILNTHPFYPTTLPKLIILSLSLFSPNLWEGLASLGCETLIISTLAVLWGHGKRLTRISGSNITVLSHHLASLHWILKYSGCNKASMGGHHRYVARLIPDKKLTQLERKQFSSLKPKHAC